MGAKEEFILQMHADLPDGIKDHLLTPIPTLVATSAPTDTDSAILAQGVLAHNLNTIFKAYEGLTLAAIPMYIAQLNTVNQGLLCAALEFVGGSGDLKIITPQDGGSYKGFFGVREGEWYVVQVLRGDVTAMSCSLGESDSFDLEEETVTGTWQAEWPTAIGSHTAVFTATYADSTTSTESVSFTVGHYATYPEEGDIVPAGDFEVTLDPEGEEFDSVTVTLTNDDSAAQIIGVLQLVGGMYRFVATSAGMVAGTWQAFFDVTSIMAQYNKLLTYGYDIPEIT